MKLKMSVFLAAAFSPAFLFAAVPEGQPAPQAAMKVLADGAVKDFPGWSAYKGKVVVLEFWSTDCAPCVANIPHLNKLAEAFKGKPLEFISVTPEKADIITKFLKKRPIEGVVGVDGYSLWKAFGVNTMPQTVLISKTGAVLRYTSPEELTEKALAKLLDTGSAADIKRMILTQDAVPVKETQALFEVRVTSVPDDAGMEYGRKTSGGSVELDFKGLSLGQLLAEVYGTTEKRIDISSGLPPQKFGFVVRGPRASEGALKPLLKQAIMAAYGAGVKSVSAERQVLLLQYDKDAPHGGLIPSETPGRSRREGPGSFRCTGSGIFDLMKVLEKHFGLPINDETGLSGKYDMTLAWTSGDKDSLAAALKAELGLSLVPASRTIEVLQVFPGEAAGQ